MHIAAAHYLSGFNAAMDKLFAAVLLSIICVSCVYHDTAAPDDCSLSDLHVTLDSIVSATSCSIRDGGIYVSVTGGVPPYTYLINDAVNPDGEFEALGPGIYSVGIYDFNGCDTLLTNIKIPADGVLFSAKFEEDKRCLGDDGAVTVEVTEGNPPYEFNIDEGPYGELNTFTGLSHGEYVVGVKDINECVIYLNVSVPRGQTGVSWANDVKPIMETYCAISGCHNGISRSNDFRKYNTVRFYSKSIRSKTQDGSMPFDGDLTQTQIDIIACWIDDGMPNN